MNRFFHFLTHNLLILISPLLDGLLQNHVLDLDISDLLGIENIKIIGSYDVVPKYTQDALNLAASFGSI